MKLHLDRDAFDVLLEDIHSRTGYRTDVLEKDYYVVLILSELAEMQKMVCRPTSKAAQRCTRH